MLSKQFIALYVEADAEEVLVVSCFEALRLYYDIGCLGDESPKNDEEINLHDVECLVYFYSSSKLRADFFVLCTGWIQRSAEESLLDCLPLRVDIGFLLQERGNGGIKAVKPVDQ
jgi:hypothetical protein